MQNKTTIKNRKPNRLKVYDYSNGGWYFLTICTNNKINHFGKLINGKVVLNEFGEIADKSWKMIDSLHKNIKLDEYVVMPNHIHGIIIINNTVGDATLPAGRQDFASPTYDRTKMELCKIIQQFKRAVTVKIKSITNNSNFKWQRSFYDRIIRNDYELYNIRKYIRQNPLKWNLEKGIENLDI